MLVAVNFVSERSTFSVPESLGTLPNLLIRLWNSTSLTDPY